MSVRTLAAVFGATVVMAATPALANDLEGVIESVDASNNSFVVQGIRFHTNDRTDYDDGLRRFEDLKEGQRVEVDFDYRDGRHIATEIELDER